MVQAERLAAVGQAVTSLAHESRNLLQTINIAAELIHLDASVDPKIIKHVACIESACDGLNSLLEEVREYAAPLRIDAERHPIQGVIADAWGSVLQAHPGRRAALCQSSPLPEKPSYDRFRMFQVFRNLFENSLAACEDPVEVSVVVKKIANERHPILSIVVSDNGPGLDPEQRRRVFEPFFTTKAKGTGLGMAIARKIMQAHRGSLSLGDEDCSGAEFRLELPL
ncbi:sensor histidine kinase [Pirellulimonas nuda]|nr:ATP-binding protein [Pirellulimonas nuda]